MRFDFFYNELSAFFFTAGTAVVESLMSLTVVVRRPVAVEGREGCASMYEVVEVVGGHDRVTVQTGVVEEAEEIEMQLLVHSVSANLSRLKIQHQLRSPVHGERVVVLVGLQGKNY